MRWMPAPATAPNTIHQLGPTRQAGKNNFTIKQKFCVVLRMCVCTQTFFSQACGPEVDKSSELRTWAPVEPVKKPGTILDWAQASTFQTNETLVSAQRVRMVWTAAHHHLQGNNWRAKCSSQQSHYYQLHRWSPQQLGTAAHTISGHNYCRPKRIKRNCQLITGDMFCALAIKIYTTSQRFGRSLSRTGYLSLQPSTLQSLKTSIHEQDIRNYAVKQKMFNNS